MYVKNESTSKRTEVIQNVSILVLLDVCKEPSANLKSIPSPAWFQSLFYWMYVKNSNFIFLISLFNEVSILVLLDVCKEQADAPAELKIMEIVSILVLLDVCKESGSCRISILVLLDVCKEQMQNLTALSLYHRFQSLFYWMYVKNESGNSLGNYTINSFNPCFIGCM